MHPMALVVCRRAIGSGSDERVRELDASPQLEQAGIHCRVGCGHVEPEGLGGTIEEQWVAEGLCGRGENEQPSIGG